MHVKIALEKDIRAHDYAKITSIYSPAAAGVTPNFGSAHAPGRRPSHFAVQYDLCTCMVILENFRFFRIGGPAMIATGPLTDSLIHSQCDI